MSRNYYSEIHLHFTCHTKLSHPLLTPKIEPFVHDYLRRRLVGTPGAFVHEIGGIETHVHLAVTIAPTILISNLSVNSRGRPATKPISSSAARSSNGRPVMGSSVSGRKTSIGCGHTFAIRGSTTRAPARSIDSSGSPARTMVARWLKPNREKARKRACGKR